MNHIGFASHINNNGIVREKEGYDVSVIDTSRFKPYTYI